MSLINEMLKDLQQQKEGGSKQKTQLKPKMTERIPFLPLPVMLAGGGVLLLLFIWWMAGVLADVMFDYESEEQLAPQTEVAQQSAAPETSGAPVSVPPEEEPLTEEERNAEPPANDNLVATTKVRAEVASAAAPAKMTVAQTDVKEESQVVQKKSPAGDQRPAAKPTKTPSKQKVVKTVTTKSPAKKVAEQKTSPTVSRAPQRLDPDQLPGAVRTPVRSAPVVAALPPRPTRLPANTPYGIAEEAYLDGKWALSRQRSNLAIQSLQHALETYPGHLQARELLVKLVDDKGQSGEAMFLLAQGLEIAPDYMPFKKSYVKLLIEQGDHERAIDVMLKGGMPSVEEDPEAHVLLASLYQKLEEPFLAAQTYRNLLVEWPQTGAFWVGLGSALEKQKLSGEAVESYQRALETKNLREDLSAFARKRLRLLN